MEDTKIINSHLNVKNHEDLVKFIENKFSHSQYRDYDLDIQYISNNMIGGYLNDVEFSIEYDYKKSCILYVKGGFPSTVDLLSKILKPLMWARHEKAKNPLNWSNPVASYITEDNRDVLVWDTYDPVKRINGIAFDYYMGDYKVKNLQIHYPGETLESLKQNFLYGEYTGFLPIKPEEIDKFSEFELFYNIFSLSLLIQEYSKAAELLEMNVNSKIEEIAYSTSYLLMKTSKFNIKTNKPGEYPLTLTKEQEIWAALWNETFARAITENPYLLEDWQKYPNDVDPNFKTFMPYDEFAKIYKSGAFIPTAITNGFLMHPTKLNDMYNMTKDQGPSFVEPAKTKEFEDLDDLENVETIGEVEEDENNDNDDDFEPEN